ncbi:MAG: hypothetical protein ACYC8T_09015 [Myxococcaceae bacterium]
MMLPAGRPLPLLCFALLGACATAHLPPGNELEDPAAEAAEKEKEKAEAEAQSSFDAGPPPVVTSLSEPEPFAASVPAPAAAPAPAAESTPDAGASPAAAAVRELSAESRADFAGRLVAARRKIGSGALTDAEPLVEELAWLASELGPVERREAAELAHRLAVAQKSPAAERRACDRWLLSCGPDRADACRAAALGALGTLAKKKAPEAAAARERLATITGADTCLARAEAAARAKSPVPSCLEGAAATYKRLGDRMMVARAHLARALSTAGDPKRVPEVISQLQRVDADCDEGRCATLRRRALRTLSNYYAKAGDLEGAAKSMLSEMAVGAALLPVEKRPYARTAEVERACAQLDAKQGAGTCRRIEKAALGGYSFMDFSRDRAARGLTPERVRLVNEHYGVLLQECLTGQAERLTPPASERYELRWMVTNGGRVEQLHLAKKEQDSGPLADCLRRQFALWRYPRYEGEAQHVEQSFLVSARERRDGGAR